MTFDEIQNKIKSLALDAKELLKESGFSSYDVIDCDIPENAEAYFIQDQINKALRCFEEAAGEVALLGGEIVADGVLHLNDNNRFEVNGYELHCGSALEYLAQNEDRHHGELFWCPSRIEAKNGQYYVVVSDQELEGLRVRIRRGVRI